PFSEVQALKNVDHKEHPPESIVDQVFNLHFPVEIFKFFSNYREMSEFKESRFRLRRFDSRVFQGKVFVSNVGNGFSGSIGDEISKYCTIQLNVKDWPLYKGDLTIPPYKQKEARSILARIKIKRRDFLKEQPFSNRKCPRLF
ncbi:MAG: hypothetical protein VXV96_12755, partial [Bdellovibrionota bacterium]|nr:hypothetical protein [Bdellovibrionota bacterium]